MIGFRLRSIRKAKRLTQMQLAQASGVAQNYISSLECGTAVNPSSAIVRRLAQALQVSEQELTAPLLPADSPLPPESHLVAPSESAPHVDSTLRLSGHEYKGYRVMAERPDGETYCAYVSVEVNGNPLPRHYWGSSRGVEWGYLGSGPEALAYDLLAFEYGDTLARNHLHSFTEWVVAQFPRYVSAAPGPHLEWTLTAAQLQEWLQEQGRPEPIRVYVPHGMWEDPGNGTPVSTVYARFLPDRRLVLGLELLNTSPMGYRQVVSAKEQELRTSPEGWLIWYDARAVDPSEYQLYRY